MNFTFLNIPVRIQPTFWIFLLFFTKIYQDPSIESIILGGVMIVSLLVHEYGHALTAVYFGAKPTITLEGFGGNASYNGYGISRAQQLIITVNGPLFESILIAVPYFLLKIGNFSSHPYVEYTLYVTMHLNILWCLLNLIPIAPLDGGKIMQYLLEDKFGPRGYKISLQIGLMSVALAAPYLYFEGYTFFPMFLLYLGFQSYQKMQEGPKREEVSNFSLYMRGIEAFNSNEIEKAKQNFKRLVKSKDTHIKNSAIESLAKIYFQENDSRLSYKLLMKADPTFLKEGKTLLCKLAFEHKNYPLICKYSQEIYSFEPSYETAILNSQAYACLNQPELAGGWMKTASQFGIEYNDKVKVVLKNAIYNSVRDHHSFDEFLN